MGRRIWRARWGLGTMISLSWGGGLFRDLRGRGMWGARWGFVTMFSLSWGGGLFRDLRGRGGFGYAVWMERGREGLMGMGMGMEMSGLRWIKMSMETVAARRLPILR